MFTAWLILPFVCIGHLAICCAIYNQTHASAMPRWSRKLIEKLVILVVLFGFGLFVYKRVEGFEFSLDQVLIQPVWFGYEFGLLTVSGAMICRWAFRKLMPRPRYFAGHQVHRHSIQEKVNQSLLTSWDAKLLGRIPGNQSTDLWVEEKKVIHPCLPQNLDGMVISHFSDLHFTGKIAKEYFVELVELSNQYDPDLVCLTGDIVDAEECIEWIQPVLGNLKSKHGVICILGNHDKRVPSVERLREALKNAGMILADSQWQTIEIDGSMIRFAGNELPWFRGAEKMEARPKKTPADEFSILLSHSPDQFEFGIRRNADLILAGHTHGGQVRLPFIGPIVAPSRNGVKFASRPFFRSGKTIMHVTRGVAGDDIIRILCAPELAMLTLNAPQEKSPAV